MSDEHPFERPLVTRKDTDWALCCLCQNKSKKDLQCPYKKECYHEAYQALEDDMNNCIEHGVALPLGVNLQCLNDGSGIANTLLINNASCHNGCRGRFRSHIVQRAIAKRTKEGSDSEEGSFSPKKPRSSFNASIDRNIVQCVCCEKFQYGKSTELGVKTVARLNTAINAEDAEAGDVHDHTSCYTKHKNDARAAKSKSSHAKRSSPVGCSYVAFVEFNHSTFKLADLRKFCDRRLNQLGSDWIGVYVHQKRFKEHILEKLGPDWSEYAEGRDVYVSHKKIIGAALIQNVNLQVSENEAKKIIDVGIMLRKYILLQQMPFDSSCLSEPVAKPLLTLLEVSYSKVPNKFKRT